MWGTAEVIMAKEHLVLVLNERKNEQTKKQTNEVFGGSTYSLIFFLKVKYRVAFSNNQLILKTVEQLYFWSFLQHHVSH